MGRRERKERGREKGRKMEEGDKRMAQGWYTWNKHWNDATIKITGIESFIKAFEATEY